VSYSNIVWTFTLVIHACSVKMQVNHVEMCYRMQLSSIQAGHTIHISTLKAALATILTKTIICFGNW